MNANLYYTCYMIACIGAVAAAYGWRGFDMRGVGRIRRRHRLTAREEDAFFERPTQARQEAVLILPRADLTATVTVLGLAGVALAAAAGFYGPLLIDRLMLGAAAESAGWAAPAPYARAAQLVGAVCFAAAAVRLLRPVMAIAAFVMAAAAMHLAVNFVLGRPLLASLGA